MNKQAISLLFLYLIVSSSSFALWKQCDPRWANDQLGWGSDTICSAGCLMTSATMVITSLPAYVNPATLNQWLKNNGGYVSGQLFVWNSIQPFGLSFLGVTTNILQICYRFKVGQFVIANVMGGQHWVLMTGCGDGWISVNDPGFNVDGYPLGEVVQFGIYGRARLPIKLESWLSGIEEILGLKEKQNEKTKMIAHQSQVSRLSSEK